MEIEPTSSWVAHEPVGVEPLDLTVAERRRRAEENDADIARADFVLVLSRESGGRETYAEARFALTLGKTVLWVGAPALSAYREGVVRCETVTAAIDIMQRERHDARRP